VSAVPIERIRTRSRQIQVMPFSLKYLDSAMEVAREVREQSVYAHLPVNWDKVASQLLAASSGQHPDRYFRIAVRGERVLGGLYGCVSPVFFADFLMAKDMGWWVRSESRGGIAALALLLDFEDWAREKGAKKIGMGQTGVHDIERTGRLFRHAGFEFVGYNAQKDL
jgi:hypothetical protein